MKIRAQLVLACFLLSVLPLSVIVVYSYESSRRALEAAYRREADARTRQMDKRLATIRGDLQQRLAEVSALPMQGSGSDRTPDVGNILMMIGIPRPPMLPKFTMTPDQRAMINEISTLGSRLGENFQTMPPAERTAMESRIQILQKTLNASMRESQSQWKQQFDAAQKQREA